MYRYLEAHIPDDTFQSAYAKAPACGYGQNQFQEFFQVEPVHIKIASKIIAKVRFPKYRISSLS